MRSDILLKELHLWDENARFPDLMSGKNEKSLINYFLNNDSLRMRELAEEISKDIDLPQVERLVVYFDDEIYVVREGNRRLATYKLLCDPNLAKEEKDRQYYRSLKESSKIQITDKFSLECLVFGTESECQRLIHRKHILHNNEAHWQDTERANYKVRSGNGKKLDYTKRGLREIISDLDMPSQIKNTVLGRGYVTTLWRVLASAPAANKYRYRFDESNELIVDNNNFGKELKAIIVDVYNKTFNSRAYNTSHEIEKYIHGIDNEYIKNKELWLEGNISSPIQATLIVDVPETPPPGVTRRTPVVEEDRVPIFGGKLFLLKGNVNNLYLDIDRIYKHYIANKNKFSSLFPMVLRASLRLLVEMASDNHSTGGIRDYVKSNFSTAKVRLTSDEKNFLSLNSVGDEQQLTKLLECGGHGYTATANLQQTLAMSVIIGKMLTVTHSKK